jgi:hypothetical protein
MDILLMRPDVAVAVTGPLAVSSVAARLTVESVDAMVGATTGHRALYADGSSISLTIVKPDIPPPDEPTRAHLRKINLQPGVSRTSLVIIDAPGFWAATMRGVLAGIALVSSQSPRGAPSVDAALRQLAPRLPGVDLAALAAELEAFRARHLAQIRGPAR